MGCLTELTLLSDGIAPMPQLVRCPSVLVSKVVMVSSSTERAIGTCGVMQLCVPSFRPHGKWL
jgi:hypothetical protein